MDNQPTPVLTWAYFVQAKNVDELRHSLLCTTLELEQTRIAVQEELNKKDDQISHLKLLLTQTIAQRDQANHKIQTLLLQNHQPPSTISTVDDGFDSQTATAAAAAFSDCDVSSPEIPLPEKGKLLQAVMKAGPLLHTLLLAGPLPQWRHPPPPLESFQLPPVVIPFPPPPPPPLTVEAGNCGVVNKKRALSLCEELDSPTATKLQRLVFH